MGRIVFDSLLSGNVVCTTTLESEAYCREFDIRTGGFISCLLFFQRQTFYL